MKLGILVNTDRNAKSVTGLTKAAVSKGHEVVLFMMDEGVKLLQKAPLANLVKTPGVRLTFCQHSADVIGVSSNGFVKEAVSGSQYDNACMNREVDRLIVL
ncbi:MAG: DsrE family protein [Thermodesulfovibrionia bacterium]|nr:DsrE family protein [Thermodesulfovibrionia bacterium]